ncbi:MAG: DUF2452 domain-containing protein, partial [Gemmatimonadota bacterium]
VYHLYRKDDDTLYFSMLSPDDWGGEPPHAHEGSYRLGADMSWTSTDQLTEREESDEVVRRLLEPGGGG